MATTVPLVDLQAQYHGIRSRVLEEIARVFEEGSFILGPAVEKFETDFASFCQTRFAMGVDSGTSALELALRAHEIGPGDEVIVQVNTFIASALAIAAVGATPRLVDIDPETLQIDVDKAAAAVTSKTRAIMPVHLYGHLADMDPIMDLARENGLFVIEDACQAHGAEYKGHRAGSIGHAAAFSFYPGKNLGAYGDGGAVVTNSDVIAKKVQLLRNYGQDKKYSHRVKGSNHRLDSVQAAILNVKLERLEEWNLMRRRAAVRYHQLFADSEVRTMAEQPACRSVWHLYVIRCRRRYELQNSLISRHIHAGIHYPVPIHLQPAFAELGHKRGDFPNAETAAREILSLPMYPELEVQQQDRIAAEVRDFCLEDRRPSVRRA